MFEIKGNASKKIMVRTGPMNITYDSILCGINANNANMGSKNQSGRGVVCTSEGSGGSVNTGGPQTNASTIISSIIQEEKIASRQAAYGQKGTPFSFSIFLYQRR